jgi:alkylation response protein AidB-like acyl-CoA dehydrogenase
MPDGRQGETMPRYKAPLDDMRFVLNEVLGVSHLNAIKAFEALDDDTINQFLAETARLAENVLAPLNAAGDHQGCKHDIHEKTVKTPDGFKDAYEQFCAAGLTAFSCDPDYGGLGMPQVLNTALSEMCCSANMSFAMYPGLSHGAYHALHVYGTEEQKNTYLPKLVSGEWSGTMCLTEPQCGTDLGLVKTKAVKQADGSYKITGTKIFISSGEHDLTENILHLVLAKIEDPSTPAGIKGISLFLVPKFMPTPTGQPGARNPVHCGRIEEKMGIHGNSTCEMNFDEAAGWLVGEANKGMKAMFVMMNEARLGVGLQGLALSEVAYQNALAYALDRKQGQPIDQKAADARLDKPAVSILQHPDVRRELLTVKAQAEGARMLAYWVAMQLDISLKDPDKEKRKAAKKCVDLLTPVVKAHMTDNAVDNTNAAMQVFGGHGYIKEHGMEQFNRDARITRLYEGTNGIQALDLIGRKVLKENLLPAYARQLRADLLAAFRLKVPLYPLASLFCYSSRLQIRTFCLRVRVGIARLIGGAVAEKAMRDVGGMATDYLNFMSYVVMGHMWVKMAAVARERLAEKPEGASFYETKIKTAQFYFDHLMPRARTYARLVRKGSKSLMALPPDAFVHDQTSIGEKSRPAA